MEQEKESGLIKLLTDKNFLCAAIMIILILSSYSFMKLLITPEHPLPHEETNSTHVKNCEEWKCHYSGNNLSTETTDTVCPETYETEVNLPKSIIKKQVIEDLEYQRCLRWK